MLVWGVGAMVKVLLHLQSHVQPCIYAHVQPEGARGYTHATATLDGNALTQWRVLAVTEPALIPALALQLTASCPVIVTPTSSLRRRRFVVFDLDPQHCVAVAVKHRGTWDCPRFREVSFQDLIGAAVPHGAAAETKTLSA